MVYLFIIINGNIKYIFLYQHEALVNQSIKNISIIHLMDIGYALNS